MELHDSSKREPQVVKVISLRFLTQIREVADLAARYRLAVSLYPHVGYLMARTADAVRLADKSGRANVGVTLNLCHWLRADGADSMDEVMQMAIRRLTLVTINGADRDGKASIQPLGSGTFDVAVFLQRLHQLGYRGPIGLQGFSVAATYQIEPLENLRRSMAAWKELSARAAAGQISRSAAGRVRGLTQARSQDPVSLTLSAYNERGSTEANVVYGMHSGLALLMDVHKPTRSNGVGVVIIPGSGWHAPLGYDAPPLKESAGWLQAVQKLVGTGYTVFMINHRAAPRFRYPAAVEDAQRAVRFVRHHAMRYRIREDRVGAIGGSSGGHLVSMLGTLDGKGDSEDPDPVQRESSKVQCVVALFPPTDMARFGAVLEAAGRPNITEFLGIIPPRQGTPKRAPDARLYAEASPVSHVSPDDPPFLLVHGDEDRVVPYQQSEIMEAALRNAGVPVKLIRVTGGGHGAALPGAREEIDWPALAIEWFETRLRKQ